MMPDLGGIAFNIELSLFIGALCSFILGFLLFLIKVPNTEYSKRLANTKNTISVSFVICSILFLTALRYSGIRNYDVFSSLMMFVITDIASVVLSYSLITLLDQSAFDTDKFFLNVGLVAIMSILLVSSFWWESNGGRLAVLIVCIAFFVLQCVIHIIKFNRTYVGCVKKVENYYDDEEDHKIRWIRFCYIIMMLTQMFVLVYLLLPSGMMKVYALFYTLFMLYFTANFISFLGSHKLLLDAFAYKTLSGHDLMLRINARRKKKDDKKVDSRNSFNEAEFAKIALALDNWVKAKKYREYDKSREEIAAEIGTSKEMLHLYFATKVGLDFRTWRTELRVEEAKRLLIENRSLSVNIIGEMSGFSDRANFYRQFVKYAGCSPREWREKGGSAGDMA